MMAENMFHYLTTFSSKYIISFAYKNVQVWVIVHLWVNTITGTEYEFEGGNTGWDNDMSLISNQMINSARIYKRSRAF